MSNFQNTKKRTLTGIVVSDAMQKTRVVVVERMARHKRYHVRYKVNTRYKAHDEQNAYHVGDVVVIQETRPLSREKRWEIIELIKKGKAKEKPESQEEHEEHNEPN